MVVCYHCFFYYLPYAITVCMSTTDLVSLRNAANGFTSVLVVAVVAAEFENSGLLGLY